MNLSGSRTRATERCNANARQLLRESDKIAGLASETFEAVRRKPGLQGDSLLKTFDAGEFLHVPEQRAEILFPDFK